MSYSLLLFIVSSSYLFDIYLGFTIKLLRWLDHEYSPNHDPCIKNSASLPKHKDLCQATVFTYSSTKYFQIENEEPFGYTELGSTLGTSMSAAGSLFHS